MDYLNLYKEKRENMKVFISWSGERSKKVALIFREWLPTVIQALEPFVSSEDIEKGSRWNTDIAQELNETKFGIICVTKDNIKSPWLNFEAGALSKTIDNSYVAPVLFEVKPSDLTNSPISQFQATSISKEDMKKLVETLNTASGNCLTQGRLDKAFELCYPDLEKNIKELKETEDVQAEEVDNDTGSTLNANILEELLETERNTQRLLGNTDAKLYNNIDQLQKKIEDIGNKIETQHEYDMRRNYKRIRHNMTEEVIFSRELNEQTFPYNVLMVLSLVKDELPWIYEVGCELVRVLNSEEENGKKHLAIAKFRNVIEYSMERPFIINMNPYKRDMLYMLRELPQKIAFELENQKEY